MELTLQALLARIELASISELDDLILALSRRYRELNPGWEISILTLPKNSPSERRRILERILEYEALREGQ